MLKLKKLENYFRFSKSNLRAKLLQTSSLSKVQTALEKRITKQIKI